MSFCIWVSPFRVISAFKGKENHLHTMSILTIKISVEDPQTLKVNLTYSLHFSVLGMYPNVHINILPRSSQIYTHCKMLAGANLRNQLSCLSTE